MSRRSRGTALRWLQELPPRRRTRIPRCARPGSRRAPRGRRRACGSSSRRCPSLASLPNCQTRPLSRRSRHIAHVAVEHRHRRRSVIDHEAQLRLGGAQFLLRAYPACDIGHEREDLSGLSLCIADRGNKIADPNWRSALGYVSIFDLELRFSPFQQRLDPPLALVEIFLMDQRKDLHLAQFGLRIAGKRGVGGVALLTAAVQFGKRNSSCNIFVNLLELAFIKLTHYADLS